MADPARSEVDIGTILADTYEITGVLGRGGMGAVWAATHRRLPGKRVAIKVLLGELATRADIYARFQREAEIASRLGHPNIVEVIDFNTLPSGTPYIVLEFLGGESLGDRLRKRGKLSLDETISIVRQIGSALHAAHRAGVVHRDLKPDNIFLTPSEAGGVLSERVKVLDFGISKIKDSSAVKTQTAAILGTPQYMAPEQAAGKQDLVDSRTDQFALGAIVYEMLAGRPAFGGETLAEIVCKVMLEQPPPIASLVPGLPPSVITTVERALAKDSTVRFPDVVSFVEALSGKPLLTLDRPAVRNDSPEAFASTMASGAMPIIDTPAPLPTAPPATAPPSTTAATTRSKTPMIIIAAVVGVAALAGAGTLLLRTTPEPPKTPTASPSPTPVASPIASPPSASLDAALAVVSPSPSPMATPSPSPAASAKPRHADDPPPQPEKLPHEVRELLAAAETALNNEDISEAMRLGKKALIKRKSSRGYSILVRAGCKRGDLGLARSLLGNVTGGDLKQVKAFCKKAGVDLE